MGACRYCIIYNMNNAPILAMMLEAFHHGGRMPHMPKTKWAENSRRNSITRICEWRVESVRMLNANRDVHGNATPLGADRDSV